MTILTGVSWYLEVVLIFIFLIVRNIEHLFMCHIYMFILPFHTVHGVLKVRILKWFAIPFSSGPHSVRPLHHDQGHLSWVAPQAWLSFIELDKAVIHVVTFINTYITLVL